MLKQDKIKIWGYIVDAKQQALLNRKVHLLKKDRNNYKAYYKEVACTYSDAKGYYEFYVPIKPRTCEYRIVIIRE